MFKNYVNHFQLTKMEILLTISLMLSLTGFKFTHAVTPALILTPLIEENKTEEARKLASVDPLLFLNVTSYSGFLTVNKEFGSNLFFWYFPVPNKPVDKTPWIIWLQGGPGASSLAGLFDEIGPFEYKKDLGLKIRESSWCNEFSMVFIDNPVGAGFSFTNSVDGFTSNMTMYSNQLYTAVEQFVRLFPELQTAPLYLAGESYAGRYVPAFAHKTLEEKAKGDRAKPSFSLKGLIMGNPVLDREGVMNTTSAFYNWGLIDAQGVIAMKPFEMEYIKAVKEGNSSAAVVLRDKFLDRLQDMASQTQLYNVLTNYGDLWGFMDYIKLENIKEALHVGTIQYTSSNVSVHIHMIPDFLTKMTPIMDTVLENYEVLIYCGQLDLTTPCVSAAEWRRQQWRWNGRDDFLKAPRIPWWYNESDAGYVKTGGRFTEVLIRGAGHLAPIDKPGQVKQLVSYFIRGLDMPMSPNYQIKPEDTPDYSIPYSGSDFKTGMIISISFNVVLVLGIVLLVVFAVRWKRRNDDYFYAPLSDGILSMS
ncbi:venom serine carboxypeptidase-like [Battus philenor]|uniref:venom serine carboxypeptidase-like n=1 Tax=Battus philenor TaxID=42288 RepID=UPI0035D0C603